MNKLSIRSLIAFLVTWSFIVLTLTGIVLYIVPHGRIAYWTHWSLLGLGKDQWSGIHMMFGGLFIVTGVWHLVFNWKPFKRYLADRVGGHLRIRSELALASALALAILVLSALALPPASWVFALNERVKDAWVTDPVQEPPFGHAEEVSLAGLARRTDLDLDAARTVLDAAGIRYQDTNDSLGTIAKRNNTTPAALYALMHTARTSVTAEDRPAATRAELEARWAGTGIGRRSVEWIAAELGVERQTALQRLKRAGVESDGSEQLRELADRYEDYSPIDLLALIALGQ